MTLSYAQSTGGFYDDAINTALPSDAVEITVEQYAALMEAQSTGQIITADSAGSPIAEAPPAPTPAQTAVALMLSARAALTITDAVFIRCGKAGVAWPTEWQAYVVALRAIVTSPASATELPTQPAYPAGS